MSWILDILVIAVVALSIFFSARRGFVRTAIEVVGLLLSVYLSFTVAGTVADALFEKSIAPAIVQTTVDSIEEKTSGAALVTSQAVWESLPETVTKVAGNFGVTSQSIAENVTAGTSAASVETVVQQSVDTVARPVVVPLVRALVSIVLLLVCSVFVKLLARVLGRVARLPVLRQVNTGLGAVLGLVKGLLIAAVLCIIISAVVSFTANGFWIFTKQNIEDSSLFYALAKLSTVFQ